ncbi:MAG TPA: thiamine-phosphate kinase [Longimicrobium sp.]|jgi:thiamine-monophosphate kinase|uniref:thiamine-phosphate kinase n=1 Tax=Longimicrobium sp. TaxID=2029185 RepID=UPI002ED90368
MRTSPSVHPRPHPDAPVRLAPGPEFDLIRRFLAGQAQGEREDVRVGPGDDCAVVAGNGIALSSDMSVEGVHFRRDWLAPEEIGWRAAAAALSDLAAVAARPIGILVSLAAPAGDAGDFAAAVMAGCRAAVEEAGGALLGGDLTRSPGPLVVDVTVVGEAPRPVLRSGARPGQEVWVTGELGGAAACVEALLAERAPQPSARERFAHPVPRVREAQWLAAHGVPTAMVDLSDGLVGDAGHLAAASGVAVMLVPELIPVHPAARERSRVRSLRRALGGGEDYELCFTAPVGAVPPLVDGFARAFGVRLTCVGKLGGGDGVWFVDAEGRRRPTGVAAWQHFGRGDA